MSTRTSTPTTPTTTHQQHPHVPHDKIAMRAYEKWCKRGRPNGSEKQDWLEAESELRQELSRNQGQTVGQRR